MIDLATWRDRVESRLPAYLHPEGAPARLVEAMQYAVMGGGKRIRPALVYLAAEACSAPPERADATACAVEMVHAYSLIHDDLPCMDDDDLRRGKPTCHIKFDDATAILAGDALQAAAFEAIAGDLSLPEHIRLELVRRLAVAIGAAGMVGGQVNDLASEHTEISEAALVQMHHAKTGALISASAGAGALIGAAAPEIVAAVGRYGYILGLAFQVKDDILDATGDTAVIGKRAGADAERRKTTFVSV
ncbi:MAG TPA: farnesyl diphosphate synthase, partial [Pseudomonadales bacterium]|nr:farnesyl diphosphate synthase [Pseudomonadales bacterium]